MNLFKTNFFLEYVTLRNGRIVIKPNAVRLCSLYKSAFILTIIHIFIKKKKYSLCGQEVEV